MFHVEFDKEAGEHVLVAGEGEKLPVRDDVWERLRNPDEIFGEWKQLLQRWSIHAEKAPLLKRECPTDTDYRTLRTTIRVFAASEVAETPEQPEAPEEPGE